MGIETLKIGKVQKRKSNEGEKPILPQTSGLKQEKINGFPPSKDINQPFHFLTIDVEDWPQSTLNHNLPIGKKVVSNTEAILDLLEEAGARATFFILGKVAETHPKLAQKIIGAGHEVGTHGFSHRSVESLSPSKFKEELHRSVDVLQQQTGQPVWGHRAADFSISKHSLPLLEYIREEGLIYDSSIFPIRLPRYGISGAWRNPHLIRCKSEQMLIEFPPATIRLAGVTLPGAGGGYLRLFPFWWTLLTLNSYQKARIPATCYLHPYEIDPNELDEIPQAIPLFMRWTQGTNRCTVRSKLRKLLGVFNFRTMAEACKDLTLGQLEVGLDLGQHPVGYRSYSKRHPSFCSS